MWLYKYFFKNLTGLDLNCHVTVKTTQNLEHLRSEFGSGQVLNSK